MKNVLLASGLILLALLSRFLPHPPNWTAISAVALFGGSVLRPKALGLAVPMLGMLISDLYFGFHSVIYFVYGAFLLNFLLGTFALRKLSAWRVVGSSFAASLLFYLITNFGVWLKGGYYSADLSGLFQCYAMALPFFKNQILGDLFFTSMLFVTYGLIQKVSVAQKA